MRPELEDALIKDFPKLFIDTDKSMYESCMYWGCAINDGWEKILRKVCGKLDALGEEGLQFEQIKEKWGLLRIYVNFYTDEVDEILHAAEKESGTVCESCGEPGTFRNSGWYRTFCDTCEENRLKHWQQQLEETKSNG